MGKMARIKIDGEKLYAAFKKRGVTAGAAGKAMGHNPSYFVKQADTGYTNPPTLVFLKNQYSIDLDEIRPDPVKEVKQDPKVSGVNPDFFAKLGEVIRSSVYIAVRDALKGNTETSDQR